VYWYILRRLRSKDYGGVQSLLVRVGGGNVLRMIQVYLEGIRVVTMESAVSGTVVTLLLLRTLLLPAYADRFCCLWDLKAPPILSCCWNNLHFISTISTSPLPRPPLPRQGYCNRFRFYLGTLVLNNRQLKVTIFSYVEAKTNRVVPATFVPKRKNSSLNFS
jgi:hypothetical protein